MSERTSVDEKEKKKARLEWAYDCDTKELGTLDCAKTLLRNFMRG